MLADMLALTDHDDLEGLPSARAAAAVAGMAFVNGVEISIEWESLQIHILGYAFDAADPALNAGLTSIRSGRIERARRMSAELAKVGIGGAFEGAMRYAANPSLISRAHFGRFLVETGVAKDLRRREGSAQRLRIVSGARPAGLRRSPLGDAGRFA